MKWKIMYFNNKVKDEAISMPPGLVAKMFHIIEIIEEFGIHVGEPYVKAIVGKQNKGLFEMRPQGKEGIARVFFCSGLKKELVILHSYIKKGSIKHQQREIKIALKRMKELLS